MNFVFYDLETTGRNATWDQILQIGAILVDSDFQEIDRFEERCRLRQGLIPEPGALIVNKTSVEMLSNVNLSHYQLIKKVYDIFNKWSPAIFIGYNTISFDEEFLRKTFFKLLLEPYTTQFNGNRRADVLGMSRTSKYYYPECINVGLNDKGNQVFKLDVLTQLNDIKHNAHDAMGDVEATIKIAQILKNKAQNVWQSGLNNSNKIEVHTRSVFLQGLLLMSSDKRPKYFSKWNNIFDEWDLWLKINNISGIEAALNFVLSEDLIDKIIVGVDSKTQLREIISASKNYTSDVPKILNTADDMLINPSLWDM